MKKPWITLSLLLLATTLTTCMPPDTPMPKIGEIVVDINAELTTETCAGFDPIVGGLVTITVTTEDGNVDGIGKVEFYVEDELLLTATETPFGFSADLNEYDDGTEFTLKADVYDLSGNLHQSKSSTLKVDNSPEPSLAPLADKLGITWGTIVDHKIGRSYTLPYEDTVYFETICQNFQLIIAEYGMYMSVMQPQQGVYEFFKADQVVEFAEANNKKIRMHPLIWGINLDWDDPQTAWVATPLWVHNGDFSRDDMIEIMYDRIETVMTHYGDRIDEWVVVNEALGFDGNTTDVVLKNTVWTQKLGDDYIELALKHAHQVDPNAYLIINEVGVDYYGDNPWINNRVGQYYKLVMDLLEKGTPIDAVGFQFHLQVGEDNPTVEGIVKNFEQYGELGLEVQITELDIAIKGPVTQEDLEEQARLYGVVMQACLESDACTNIAVWGHSDKYTWYKEWGADRLAPCLFDETHQPKPAFYSTIEVMETYLGQK